MLRAALALAERGFCVFPCQPRGKAPACINGCHDATTDADQITRWWRHSNYNIGVATGEGSGIFVVDIDGVDAESELRKLEVEHGELPSSVESITARGRHIFFRWPSQPVRNSAGAIAPGIDVRGNGGHVLAPPSIHPSGKKYCWSVDSARTFAEAPQWLLTKVTSKSNGKPIATPATTWRQRIVDGADESAPSRNCAIASLAGVLLRRGIDPIVTLELVQSWNATHVRPPLPPDEVERIVGSIAKKELRRRGHG